MRLTNSFLTTYLFVLSAVLLNTANAASLQSRGKSCSKSTDCNVAKQHFCNHGTCAKAVAEGQGCYKNQGCLSGLCYNSKCASSSSRPLGAACTASTQCKSAFCGQSTCRSPVPNGGSCTKDVGCTSKKCDKSKGKCVSDGHSPQGSSSATRTATTTTKPTAVSTTGAMSTTLPTAGAPTTATSTASAMSTTFPTNGAPPAPTEALAVNGDFSNGQLSPFVASSTGTGSRASVQKVDGNYVAVIDVGPGGSLSMTRPLDVNGSKLSKRRTAQNWFLSGVVRISSFTKGATASTEDGCKAVAIVGGTTYDLYDWVYDYSLTGAYSGNNGWSHFGAKWPTGPTEATIKYSCDPGMSAQFQTDNYAIGPYLHLYKPYTVNDPGFESGTFANGWQMYPPSSSDITSYGIQSNAANAHSGSHYLEATTTGKPFEVSYEYDDDSMNYDSRDENWESITMSFWYNLVSLEDTWGDTSIHDGCVLQYGEAGSDGYEQALETTSSSSRYMQVNDPALKLPTGWKKVTMSIPYGQSEQGASIFCEPHIKATVRFDDFSISVPQNDTAT